SNVPGEQVWNRRNRRVLLPHPPYIPHQTIPPLGFWYLASCTRENREGTDVRMIDCNVLGALLCHSSHRPDLAGRTLSETLNYHVNPDERS
ncbi:MAG: hypothetical protein KAW84_02615, partial [Thermoplasmata archaeon]|nr:hypothetical protein [Thermoplasmata archaeon]